MGLTCLMGPFFLMGPVCLMNPSPGMHKSHPFRQTTLSKRHPRISGASQGGRNTRNNAKTHPMLLQKGHLFAPAAKDKTVTAFETHHIFTCLRMRQQQTMDALLSGLMIFSNLLAYIDPLGISARPLEHRFAH